MSKVIHLIKMTKVSELYNIVGHKSYLWTYQLWPYTWENFFYIPLNSKIPYSYQIPSYNWPHLLKFTIPFFSKNWNYYCTYRTHIIFWTKIISWSHNFNSKSFELKYWVLNWNHDFKTHFQFKNLIVCALCVIW